MNILFVTYNRIGDAVLSTGILSHLIDAHADARITIACGPPAAPLFQATPKVTRVLALAKRPHSAHWLTLWRAVVGQRWDLVIDLRGSALAWTLWASRRRVLQPSAGDLHRVRHIASVLGLEPPPSPRIWSGPAQDRAAAALLPDGGPILAIGPTANWGGKQWPADRFAALIAQLTGPGAILAGARVAVMGAEAERPMAQPVIDAIPAARRIDLFGKADLLTVFACLKRVALYVGNDSGLMHLAAAAGAPTLGLFGPSRDALYAPWGPHTAVVRTDRSFAEIRNDPTYDYRSQTSWMTGLDVDKVEAAAVALYQRAHAGAA